MCCSGCMVYLARGNSVAGCCQARGWVRCGVLCVVRWCETCVFCVVWCLDGVEGEWWAGLGVGCGWVAGGGVGSGWGPWVYVAGVGQGGLCVVKSGGKVCVCGFGVVRKVRLLAQLPCEQRSRSHMGVCRGIV